MTARQKPAYTLLVTSVLVIALCQALHWYLTTLTSFPAQVFSTPMLELNLVYSENRGMNFGLFASGTVATRLIVISVALAVCAGLAVVFLRKRRTTYAIAGGMIIGGGLSNIFERISYGFVFDYINTPVLGLNNIFSYNVADVFIVLPIIWWVLVAR